MPSDPPRASYPKWRRILTGSPTVNFGRAPRQDPRGCLLACSRLGSTLARTIPTHGTLRLGGSRGVSGRPPTSGRVIPLAHRTASSSLVAVLRGVSTGRSPSAAPGRRGLELAMPARPLTFSAAIPRLAGKPNRAFAPRGHDGRRSTRARRSLLQPTPTAVVVFLSSFSAGCGSRGSTGAERRSVVALLDLAPPG